jgi:hypothetical protein
MAKRSGLGDNLYVSGVDLSGDVGSLSRVGGGPSTLDVTGIDKSATERIGGLLDGSIDFAAFFNDAAGRAHPTLGALPTGQRIVTYCRGTAIGSHAASCIARQLNYDGDRGADGAFGFSISAASDGTGVQWGELLTAGKRIDTTATNGTALDGAAASAFGFSAFLHVFAFTGTNITIKLQESSDNGGGDAFADVVGGGFTVVAAAPASQRIAAAPVSLERYVRVVTTGTFTSCTFAVVLVRHLTAVSL